MHRSAVVPSTRSTTGIEELIGKVPPVCLAGLATSFRFNTDVVWLVGQAICACDPFAHGLERHPAKACAACAH
mgnify:CR=1 FL=1